MVVSGIGEETDAGRIEIILNQANPEESRLFYDTTDGGVPVGFGKHGHLPAGSVFRGGHSLLGMFRVTAILTKERFEMKPELIRESGKSRKWLAEHLFANMSSIDFDGDGKGGEYGGVFIGLEPIESKEKQPFHFGEYKGVFRWYSYAIHGTQDESRIGKCVTGGCINVGKEDLFRLADAISLGDQVLIRSGEAAAK